MINCHRSFSFSFFFFHSPDILEPSKRREGAHCGSAKVIFSGGSRGLGLLRLWDLSLSPEAWGQRGKLCPTRRGVLRLPSPIFTGPEGRPATCPSTPGERITTGDSPRLTGVAEQLALAYPSRIFVPGADASPRWTSVSAPGWRAWGCCRHGLVILPPTAAGSSWGPSHRFAPCAPPCPGAGLSRLRSLRQACPPGALGTPALTRTAACPP